MSGGSEKEVHWFRVINNSAASQKYIFFAPPPGTDFDTPAWIASDSVDNETVWNVHTTAPIFAEIFDLVFKDGDFGLQDTGKDAQTPNTFTVVTKDIPKDGKTYVLGFGKRNPNGTSQGGPVQPCASIRVKPNTSQDVTPIIQLYVSNIPTTPGDLIDFNDRKGKSAHINFAGHTENAALCTIFHKTSGDSDAVWDTAYDNTLPEA
ncbi:hypothetical protein AnigIFM56816_002543 [Aspergillus niger]|nr:hypothetical protein AnigIFM56816_002543 [Aspergillus niger]